MNIYAGKSKGNPDKTIVNTPTQKQDTAVRYADNRPEAITQRMVQDMADKSLQIRQLKAIQELADHGAHPDKNAVPPVQGVFKVEGMRDKFIELLNAILAPAYEAVLNGKKELQLDVVNAEIALGNTPATRLVRILNTLINDGNTIIGFVESHPGFSIGEFGYSAVDLEDVKAFGINLPAGRGPEAAAVLAHELYEQYAKQNKGLEYDKAHARGIKVEEYVTGGRRMGTHVRDVQIEKIKKEEEDTEKEKEKETEEETGEGEILVHKIEDLLYVYEKSVVLVSITFDYNQVTNVSKQDITEKVLALMNASREEKEKLDASTVGDALAGINTAQPALINTIIQILTLA